MRTPTIKVKNDIKLSDSIKIELIENGLSIGHIVVSEKYDNSFFDEFLSEDEIDSMLSDLSYIVLDELYIDPRHRYKGYGNLLMENLDYYLKKYFPNKTQLFLYADPFEQNIPLKILKKFYNKYGFSAIPTPNLIYFNYDLAVNYKENLMVKNLN